MKNNIKDILYIGLITLILVGSFIIIERVSAEQKWCSYFYDHLSKDL